MKEEISKKYVALVGVGYWGNNLLRVFDKLGVLKTFYDIDSEIVDERSKRYSEVNIAKNFNEILKDEDIKAVVIATPAPTHYALAKKALMAGKDVLVEKPLALKLKEGEELVRIAKSKKRILMVDHLFLYHPALPEIKKMVENGDFGKIFHVYFGRLNLGIVRKGENVIWSIAPHDVSLAIEIFKKMPKSVSANGWSHLNKKNFDIANMVLDFGNNAITEISVSWLNPVKERKMTIIGSDAMLVFDDVNGEKLVFNRYKINWIKNQINIVRAQAIKSEPEIIGISGSEPLMNMANHFLECVIERKNPKSNGQEACKVLKVFEACEKSIKKGGVKIKI